MDKIIHYTSRKKWKKIRQEGYLLPLSNPLWSNFWNRGKRKTGSLAELSSNLFNRYLYLAGIPEDSLPDWEEYGVMPYLKNHTTCEVKLSVPILHAEGAFVREHAYLTPKTFMEVLGFNMWEKCCFKEEEKVAFYVLVVKYLESTVHLREYQDQYLVPEVW